MNAVREQAGKSMSHKAGGHARSGLSWWHGPRRQAEGLFSTSTPAVDFLIDRQGIITEADSPRLLIRGLPACLNRVE